MAEKIKLGQETQGIAGNTILWPETPHLGRIYQAWAATPGEGTKH